MVRKSWQFGGAVSLIALLTAGSVQAQSSASTDQIERMEAQIKALERELQAMKKKLGSAEKAHAEAPPAAKPPASSAVASATMSPMNRPGICSADGRNCISITSRIQMDTAGYNYNPHTTFTAPQHLDSGFNVRRAQIGIVGTFLGDWTYGLIYDFGGSSDGFSGAAGSTSTITSPPGGKVTTTTSLLPGGYPSGIVNAYLSYTGIKQLTVTLGYIDTPYSIEGATSSVDTLFLERASPQTVAANIAAGIIRSAFGAKWNNDWLWAGIYLTGPNAGAVHVASSTPSFTGLSEQYGGFARVAAQIINQKNATLHIGGNAEFLFKAPLNDTTGIRSLTLSDRPELRVDPTSILSTGAIANVDGVQVYSAEAAETYGPFYIQGEYFDYSVDRLLGLPSLNFTGSYVMGSWTVTGEAHPYNAANANYTNIVPNDPFTLKGGGLGAWEIAARYSVINLNDRLGFANGVAGGKQTIYTAGINWYANRNVKFMLDYFHGVIDKQKSPTDRADVGANFDAVAMRTQVAF
jgi:phosphate-selective porin OprO and OprP